MKTLKWLLAFLVLATVGSSAAWAHDRGRAHFGLYLGVPGPYWGPWGYPPPYYYPPYYPPAVVIERQPPVYIEQSPPPAAAPAPAPQSYWYYCAAAKGYYPYVKECPSGWQPVQPQPAQ